MAKIRKRNEEELNKEREIESELKEQRHTKRQERIDSVLKDMPVECEERNFSYDGKHMINLRVFNNGSHGVNITDEYKKLPQSLRDQLMVQAGKSAQLIKVSNQWPEYEGGSALVALGDLIVGVDIASKPDISVMVGGKAIKGVKEIILDIEGLGNKLNKPIKGRSAKVLIADDIQNPPIMKGHDPKSATLDSDDIKRLIDHTRISGRKSGKTELQKVVEQTSKRIAEESKGFLPNALNKLKNSFANAWPNHPDATLDKDATQKQIDKEIKRGEAQKVRDKKREGCKRFQVHFTKQKYLSKDYAFDVYYKDLKIIDIEQPNFAEVMMNDPGDMKHIRIFEKILQIELRKRHGRFPLSLAMGDTILDDYIIGDL